MIWSGEEFGKVFAEMKDCVSSLPPPKMDYEEKVETEPELLKR